MQVMKENQELHKGSKVIDQESATLADMNIFPGDRLWVRDTEMHEHRDIAGNQIYHYSAVWLARCPCKTIHLMS
jgi:hypothetical protein